MLGPGMSRPLAAIASLLAAGVLACEADPHAVPAGPAVVATGVDPGPYNALSAVVRTVLRDSHSARVRFGAAGGALDRFTPATAAPLDSLSIPVLGLEALTAYRLVVVAYGAADSATGDTLAFVTGALPADLPLFTAAGSDPSPGFVVFGAYPYGVVVDNTGRVVWYRRIEGGPTLNFQVQPTGHYATSPVTPAPGDPAPWVLYDVLGNEVRRVGCLGGLGSRFHEFRDEPDGSAWLLCDETRVMNLTALGGHPEARVTATVVQHVHPAVGLLFQWNAFDHFALTDLDSVSRSGATVNFTHGNAFDFDEAGHLLVSFRSLHEVTCIDTATGMIHWRLGGRAGQFALQDGAVPFAGQHGLRVIGPGRLQLLDNRGTPGDSRAVRWEIDDAAHTARLRGTYHASPPADAQLGGSTQALAGGRILVAYGNGHRVQEYDAAGTVVWELQGDPGYVFRAARIASLYAPGR